MEQSLIFSVFSIVGRVRSTRLGLNLVWSRLSLLLNSARSRRSLNNVWSRLLINVRSHRSCLNSVQSLRCLIRSIGSEILRSQRISIQLSLLLSRSLQAGYLINFLSFIRLSTIHLLLALRVLKLRALILRLLLHNYRLLMLELTTA